METWKVESFKLNRDSRALVDSMAQLQIILSRFFYDFRAFVCGWCRAEKRLRKATSVDSCCRRKRRISKTFSANCCWPSPTTRSLLRRRSQFNRFLRAKRNKNQRIRDFLHSSKIFSCPAQVLWIILILSRCRPHCSTVYRPINPSIVEMDRTWTEARSRYLLQRLCSLWIFVVCREFHVRARRNQHEKVNIPSCFFVNLIISQPSHLFIMLLYFIRIFFSHICIVREQFDSLLWD